MKLLVAKWNCKERKRVNQKNVLKNMVLLTLLLTWVDIVVDFKIPIHLILMIGTLIFTVYYIIINKIRLNSFINKCFSNSLNKCFFIILNIYILWDLISITYSPVKVYSILKYKSIIPMYILYILICFILEEKSDIYKILLVIGVGSIIISSVSLLSYFNIIPLEIPFKGIICLLDDYNISSITILIGTFILLILAFDINKNFIRAILYINVIGIITIPVIYNGGSRRAVLLLFFDTFIILSYYILKLKKIRRLNLKSVTIIVISSILIGLITMLTQITVKQYSVQQNYTENKEKDKEEFVPKDGYDVNDRYKTIYKGGALSKRREIWKIALKDLSKFNKKELLVGRGSGYSSYIYSDIYYKDIQKLYSNNRKGELGGNHPHNSILIDALDGGVIRTALGIILGVMILLQNIRIFKKDILLGVIQFLILITVFSDVMISGRYGYIYLKTFWILISLNFAIVNVCGNYNKHSY